MYKKSAHLYNVFIFHANCQDKGLQTLAFGSVNFSLYFNVPFIPKTLTTNGIQNTALVCTFAYLRPLRLLLSQQLFQKFLWYFP